MSLVKKKEKQMEKDRQEYFSNVLSSQQTGYMNMSQSLLFLLDESTAWTSTKGLIYY